MLLRFEGRKELPVFIAILQKLDWCGNEQQMPAFVSIVEQLKTFPVTAEAADQLFIKEWRPTPISGSSCWFDSWTIIGGT